MRRDAMSKAEELLYPLAHLRLAVFVFDGEADSGQVVLTEEHALVRPERNEDAIVGREKTLAFFGEDAYDAKRDVLNLDALSERRFIAKEIGGELGAQNGDAGALLIVEARDGEATFDIHRADGEIIFCHAVDRHGGVALEIADLSRAGALARDGGNAGELRNGLGVATDECLDTARADRADARAARANGHEVRAGRSNLLFDARFGAFRDGEDGDDCRHTNHHPERGERRAHSVGDE